MKRNLRRFLSFALVLTMLVSFFGCAGTEEPRTTQTGAVPNTQVQTEIQTQTLPSTGNTTTPDPETPPSLPEHMNPLTGLACDPTLVGKRPVAVMLNNLKEALPQSGLSKCDIIYEVLAEGGILRMEGVILDYANAGELGSVRSARPYYVELAAAYDAIFAHAGGSDEGYDAIKKLGVNSLDGVKGNFNVNGKSVFYRNQTRLNQGVSLEHTMFTNGSNLAQGVAKKGYRTELNNADFTAFNFDPAFTSLNGDAATYAKIPHSNYSVSEFRYDSASGLYLHSQYAKAHVDGETNEQVATENVFILFTKQTPIAGKTTRTITLTGQGQGYYLTGGQAVSITWKRQSQSGAFSYYLADGTELNVKCGRSYISIVDQDTAASVTIS